MYHLILLVLIPVGITAVAATKFKETITPKEYLLMLVLGVSVATGGFFAARWGAMLDTENWNGRITRKVHSTQSCCHCRQVCDTCRDSQGNTSSCNCREICDHSLDYYWSVIVSTGDEVMIDQCEPSKNRVPEAWTKAFVGEAASVAHKYQNYLLADPDSLLRQVPDETLLSKVPSNYPRVHEFYRVSKVVSDGVTIAREWQPLLMEMNADIGDTKQVDVTVIFTYAKPEWADALEAKWLYGPKNSVNIVAGVDRNTNLITWVRVVTISKVENLKVSLREALVGKSVMDAEGGVKIIRSLVMRDFKRTPMAEWEYLATAATPSTWLLVLLYLAVVGGTIGLGVWAHREDIFGERFRRSGFGLPRRRRRW